MEERSIAFQALHKDELAHEVRIRDVAPADDVASLRIQLKTLAKDIPTDSIVSFEGKVPEELSSIQSKLKELSALTTTSARPDSLKSLTRIQALAHHLYHRLTRLESHEDVDKSIYSELLRDLSKILSKLDNMFSIFKSTKPDASDASHTVSLPAVTQSKHQPVHKLNIKFNGSSCVREFLIRLEELSASRGISEETLFTSAPELFTGDVLCWYRSIKSEISSWSELKKNLVDEYLPHDFDRRLMQEIRSRTQGPGEDIVTYVSVMHNYFGRLSYPVSEKDKFDIVYQNIRPEYSIPLCTQEITNLKRLKELCRMLECGKYRARGFTDPPKRSGGLLAPDLAHKGQGHKPPICSLTAGENKFCVRCRVTTHSLQDCSSTAIACYRCGKNGFRFPKCPNCNPSSVPSGVPDVPSKNTKN